MILFYPEIKEKVKTGDKLLTKPCFIPTTRIVEVIDEGILIKGMRFRWDCFFEVNVILEIL